MGSKKWFISCLTRTWLWNSQRIISALSTQLSASTKWRATSHSSLFRVGGAKILCWMASPDHINWQCYLPGWVRIIRLRWTKICSKRLNQSKAFLWRAPLSSQWNVSRIKMFISSRSNSSTDLPKSPQLVQEDLAIKGERLTLNCLLLDPGYPEAIEFIWRKYWTKHFCNDYLLWQGRGGAGRDFVKSFISIPWSGGGGQLLLCWGQLPWHWRIYKLHNRCHW